MMWRITTIRALLLWCASLSQVTVANVVKDNNGSNTVAATSTITQDDSIMALKDWLMRNGALFTDRIEIRHLVEDDPTSVRGMFAKEEISQGHVLFTIPYHLFIVPEDEESDDPCETIDVLYRQFQLPEEEMTPYAKYLKGQPQRYLPSLWSDAGKQMLGELLDAGNADTPYPQVVDAEDYYSDKCEVEDADDLYIHAWMIVTARGDDYRLTPFYDMANHRNGHHYNTKTLVGDESALSMVTNRNIAKNEQIHNSYNMCNECGNRSHWHDTLWMFRGYGFVEMYPRRLVLENEEVRLKFTIDKNETTGQLVVDFAVPVGESVVKFFNDEMERLIQFRNKHYGEDTVSLSSSSSSALSSTTFLGKKPDAMPLLEWQNIGELWAALYEAYVTANEAASTMDLSEEVWEMGEEWYAPESEEEDDDDDNYDDDNYEYENENAYSYGHDTFEHHDHADDYDYDTQSDNMSHEYDGGESTDDEVLAEDSNHEKHPWNQRHHSASQHDEL